MQRDRNSSTTALQPTVAAYALPQNRTRMATSLFKIVGGTIHDPLHGIDGQTGDIWIEGEKIVAAPTGSSRQADRTLDARGLVVMPGGVDMHCHIAGPKVNVGRKLRADDKRDAPPLLRTPQTFGGTMGSVPSTFATGYKYAGLGYTTAMDAAVAPLAARHAHREFAETPCLDKGFFVLLGNNHYALQAIADGDQARLQNFLAWILSVTKGYAPKLVNPGGVENWKSRNGNASDLDASIAGFEITPRQIIATLAEAANRLDLPHALHIHTTNLGLPGNWSTTLETMKLLGGLRGHLAHIQFHSYGGGDADERTFYSNVAPLAEYVNAHPNITVDVGQVLFGQTTSMTGDGPLGHFLSKLYGTRWFSHDVENEAGCGISPIEYKHKSLVHAWQWVAGLEWFLMVDDPWQVAMSTDHPNGAAFHAYPQIIRLLMDSSYRTEMLNRLPARVREQCQLRHINREYSLQEICIITRAGPAKMLGLRDKGHLAPGTDADLTLYLPSADRQAMFEMPRYVIKAGEMLVDDGELNSPKSGKTLHVAPERDPDFDVHFSRWFDEHYTLKCSNYVISDDELAARQQIACVANR